MQTFIPRCKLTGQKQMTWWVLKVGKSVGFSRRVFLPMHGRKFSFNSNFHIRMKLPKASKYTSNWFKRLYSAKRNFFKGERSTGKKDGSGLQFIILWFNLSKLANLVLI